MMDIKISIKIFLLSSASILIILFFPIKSISQSIELKENKQLKISGNHVTIITDKYQKQRKYIPIEFRKLVIPQFMDNYDEKLISFTSVFLDFKKDNRPDYRDVKWTGIPNRGMLFLGLKEAIRLDEYRTRGSTTFISIPEKHIESLIKYNIFDIVSIQGKAKIYDYQHRLEEIEKLRLNLKYKRDRGEIDEAYYQARDSFYRHESFFSYKRKLLHIDIHKMKVIRKSL